MLRSVSILVFVMAGFGLATPLSAQRTVRVGVGVVPALNRTVDLGIEVGNGKDLEFFGQVGYMLNARQDDSRYPEGYSWRESSGSFLKIGGRLTSDQSKRWRVFGGPQLTGSVLKQGGSFFGYSIQCCCIPCPQPPPVISSETLGLFAVGGSAGVSVQVMKRLEVDLGVELNKVLTGEDRLLQPDAYKPGIGSTPFQALLNVQYRIK